MREGLALEYALQLAIGRDGSRPVEAQGVHERAGEDRLNVGAAHTCGRLDVRNAQLQCHKIDCPSSISA